MTRTKSHNKQKKQSLTARLGIVFMCLLDTIDAIVSLPFSLSLKIKFIILHSQVSTLVIFDKRKILAPHAKEKLNILLLLIF